MSSLLVRPLPSWSLSEPFCSTSWSMAIYLSSSSCHLARCLPSCSSELSPLRLAGLTHLKLLSSSSLQSKARVWGVDVLVCEDSRYLLKYWFVKAIPSCGGAHLHDMFKSCTLRWYQDFRLGCIFFLFLLSLVLSVNSPNATTLHSRCIWEGVLRI